MTEGLDLVKKKESASCLSPQELNMLKPKEAIVCCAEEAINLPEFNGVGALRQQVNFITTFYGDNSKGILNILFQDDNGVDPLTLSENDNLKKFFNKLQSDGILTKLLSNPFSKNEKVSQALILKCKEFLKQDFAKKDRDKLKIETDTAKQERDNSKLENYDSRAKDLAELQKSTVQVKAEVIDGLVPQDQFETKKSELDKKVRNNASVKKSGLSEEHIKTIVNAQAVDHFLSNMNVPADKSDIVNKFKLDYQKVSTEYGFGSSLDGISSNSLNNYSTTLLENDKTKKQVQDFVQQNKSSINVDGIRSVPNEAKQTILAEQYGSTLLKEKEETALQQIFSDLNNQNDEVKKLVGDRNIQDISQISAEEKKAILIASGFYDKLFEQNSADIKNEIQTYLAHKAIDGRGKFIANNLAQLKISGGYIQNHDFEGGNSSFDLKANVEGIDINQHFNFKSDGLYVNDATINGGVSKSSDRRLAELPSNSDFLKALGDIDYSKFSGIKNKDDIYKAIDYVAEQKLAGLQSTALSPDVINNFVNTQGAKKGAVELFVPEDELSQIFKGGEVHKAKNPDAFAFYEIVSNTFKEGENSDISFLSNPKLKYLLTQTVLKGEKSEVTTLDLFRSLGLTKIGAENTEQLNTEKMIDLGRTLEDDNMEYVAQNIEKFLGVSLDKIGFKLSKGDSIKGENTPFYFEKV